MPDNELCGNGRCRHDRYEHSLHGYCAVEGCRCIRWVTQEAKKRSQPKRERKPKQERVSVIPPATSAPKPKAPTPVAFKRYISESGRLQCDVFLKAGQDGPVAKAIIAEVVYEG